LRLRRDADASRVAFMATGREDGDAWRRARRNSRDAGNFQGDAGIESSACPKLIEPGLVSAPKAYEAGPSAGGANPSSSPSGPPVDESLDEDQARAEALRGWLLAVADRQDREAFSRLHAFFAPRLNAYLLRTGLTHAQAEDIVQDAMFAVWRKARLFDPRHGRVSTWVFVIARNLRVDYFRRRTKRDAAALEGFDPIDESPSGEESLLAAERDAFVRQALRQLSAEQAEIVEQAYFAEKPQTAIARDLGVPLGTVKSRTRLALARLRKLLSEPR
jgi:RNA polymerase sigma-70 factor (ECF subfamily)